MDLNQQAQRMLNSVPSQHCSIQGLLRAHMRYCRWYLTPHCNTTPNDNRNGNGITDIQMHYAHSCVCAFAYSFLPSSHPCMGCPSFLELRAAGLFFFKTWKMFQQYFFLYCVIANSILCNGWLWRSFSPPLNCQALNFEIILLCLEPLYIVLNILKMNKWTINIKTVNAISYSLYWPICCFISI